MTASEDKTVAYLDLAIAQIGQSYGSLRMIDPKAEASMRRSLQRYGQITPVIVGETGEQHFEMVDGFKRLRAGGQLGYPTLKARRLDVGKHALKAAMIHLNIKARTIADFEQGLVVQSLHREDGLSQVQIAILLARHKSWVCRRLSLVERLSDEVLEHLKVGLLTTSCARELAKLPRGNQAAALQTILKYQFTSHETAGLVGLLLKEPRWNHQSILAMPESILSQRHPDRPCRLPEVSPMASRLIKIELLLNSQTFLKPDLTRLNPEEQQRIGDSITRIETALNHIKKQLDALKAI